MTSKVTKINICFPEYSTCLFCYPDKIEYAFLKLTLKKGYLKSQFLLRKKSSDFLFMVKAYPGCHPLYAATEENHISH